MSVARACDSECDAPSPAPRRQVHSVRERGVLLLLRSWPIPAVESLCRRATIVERRFSGAGFLGVRTFLSFLRSPRTSQFPVDSAPMQRALPNVMFQMRDNVATNSSISLLSFFLLRCLPLLLLSRARERLPSAETLFISIGRGGRAPQSVTDVASVRL